MKATEWMISVRHRLGPWQLSSIHRTRSRKRARRLARDARRKGHAVDVMQCCPGCPWTSVGEKLRRRGQARSYFGGMKFSYPVALSYAWIHDPTLAADLPGSY